MKKNHRMRVTITDEKNHRMRVIHPMTTYANYLIMGSYFIEMESAHLNISSLYLS